MLPSYLNNAAEHYTPAPSSPRSAWQPVAAQPFLDHQYNDNSSAQYPIVTPASSVLDVGYSLSPGVRDATAWSHRLDAPLRTPAPQSTFTAFPPLNAPSYDADTLSRVERPKPHKSSAVKDLPWDREKDTLQKYHMVERKPMKELRRIMMDAHQFNAT